MTLILSILAVAGCATNEQGQAVLDTAMVNTTIVRIFTPPPPPLYVEETYIAMPNDIYIMNVADADVVIVSGDTYIWTVDEHGRRYRRFYAHGNHRDDVFRRHEELHHVMARNNGHLPEHDRNGRPAGIPNHEQHDQANARNTNAANGFVAGKQAAPGPGAMPATKPAAMQANKPALAQTLPAKKDDKKTDKKDDKKSDKNNGQQ